MSNPDLVQYIVEQAAKAGEVQARKMFGDYALYCNGKVVGLICDDYLYLKPLKQLEPLLHEDDRNMQPPYDGAKPHYVITDIDDADYVSLLVKTEAEMLPDKNPQRSLRRLSIALAMFTMLTVFFSHLSCTPHKDTIREAIEQQMHRYPQSTLQDIYKSFYQARFGSGHMISDTAAVRAYLLYELTAAAEDDTIVKPPFYEQIGANNAYVRVYLSCINRNVLTTEQLFNAFVRSASPAKQPEQSWADEWAGIEQAARKCGIPHSEEECILLRQAAQNNQAVHHSEQYRTAYRPHYRIVRRDIFNNELDSYIDK